MVQGSPIEKSPLLSRLRARYCLRDTEKLKIAKKPTAGEIINKKEYNIPETHLVCYLELFGISDR